MSLYRVIFACANWWLRDPASAANFANVNNNGNCNYNNASNAWVGVRPDFGNATIRPYRKAVRSTERKGYPCCKAKRQCESRAASAGLPYVVIYEKPISGA